MKKAWPLLIVPLVALCLYRPLTDWSGPRHYQPSSDPQYIYLLNSLAVAVGSSPGHMDHPGATVHAIGALVLKATHRGATSQELAGAVLADPETGADTIAIALVGISALLIFLSGLIIWRTSPLGMTGALLFQAWPFVFVTVWAHLPRLQPDFLLLCLAQLFCAVVLAFRPTRSFAILLGSLLGLLLVTKISALLFSAAPILLLWRRKKLLALAYGIAGSVFALVIVVIYRTGIERFVRYFGLWSWSLVSRKGWYGVGSAGLPDADMVGFNLSYLAGILPVFFLVALLCIVFFPFLLRKHAASPGAWLVFSSITVGQIFLMGKAVEPRYAIPALPASAGALLLLVGALLHGTHLRNALRGLAAFTLALTVLAFSRNREQRRQFRDDVAEVERALPPGTTVPKVCAGVGSGVDCALHWGNHFTRNRFSRRLLGLYPSHLFWDGNPEGTLLNMRNQPKALTDLLDEFGVAYFHGRSPKGRVSLGIEIPELKTQLLIGPKATNSAWKVEK